MDASTSPKKHTVKLHQLLKMKNIQLLEEFDNASIFYDNDLETLFLSYKGPVKDHDDFVKINYAVLSAFKKYNTQKFAVDVRDLELLDLKSQNWIRDVLFTGMIEHLNGRGLYHAQLIDEDKILSKLAATNIKIKAADLEDGINIEQFSSETAMREKLAVL